MHAKPPTARVLKQRLPRRLGDPDRYPPRLNRNTIELYDNTSTRLSMLPDRIELHGTAAFGDGGTISLASELADSTELRFNLPPANCVLYPDRKPQLYLQIYYADSRTAQSHTIAVRSELESQIINLLENGLPNYRETRLDLQAREHYGYPVEQICEEDRDRYNNDIVRIRNKIVSFVKSDEYTILNHPPSGG